MVSIRIAIAAGALVTAGLVMAEPSTENPADPAAASHAVTVSGNARFTVLTPALLRLEWSPTGKFEDRASYAFINRRLPVPRFDVRRSDGWVVIGTEKLTLRYREGSGKFDKANLAISPRGGSAEWRPGMKDTANLRGTVRTLDDVSGSRPLDPGILSREGWVLVDDSNSILFDNSDWPWAVPRADSKALDWYFFGHGNDFPQALRDFMQVAGRIPLPPRYVLGAWWSRYWNYTADEFKALVAEFREHGVPLDVLVVDMDWHLDGWTGYTWNPKYFPDPEGFLKWAHDEGLRVTLNLHPADGVGKHEKAFPEVARAMSIDPETTDRVPFNCADRRFMDAYFKFLHHPLERTGVDFWWLDWQQGTGSGIEGLDPLPWLNYLHWTDMERNPERAGKRPLIMSRWGGLGGHRYPLGFSGDTYCNWQSLAFQPYFTSTAGNVGFSWWSHDIGGHRPGATAPELYARWIQFGALNPVLRTHGTKNQGAERRIWAFPEDAYRAAKKAWLLRYALIPYLYAAAREAHDTGIAACRPLYYEWPAREEAYQHPGEYLLGNDLLVAPVVEPDDPVSSCALVRVWMPPGEWVNWFTGETTTGPREVVRTVPFDEIPLWARAGAIIPMAPVCGKDITGVPPLVHGRNPDDVFPNSSSQPRDFTILRVFPGERGETVLYEDDGESTGYLAGQFARTHVETETTAGAGRTRIVIHPAEGGYPGMPEQRRFGIHLCGFDPNPSPTRVTVNGTPLVADFGLKSPAGWSPLPGGGIYIRTLAFPAGERIEAQVERVPSAMAEALRRAGAAGLANAIRTAGEQLGVGDFAKAVGPVAPDGVQLKPAEEWTGEDARHAIGDTALRAAREALRHIDGNRSAARKAAMQLLGIHPELKIAADADGALGISARAWLTRPVRGLRAAFEASAPGPDWSPVLARFGEKPLVPGEPLDFRAGISRPVGAPAQTQRLEAQLILSAEDFALTIPIHRQLFPSVNAWWVVGPFDNPGGVSLDKAFPPEAGIDLKARYKGKGGKTIRWQKVERPVKAGPGIDDEFFVDFHECFGAAHDNAVAYALAYLHAPRDMKVVIPAGADDGLAMWLNGTEIHRNPVGRAYTSKSDRVEVALRKGDNPLLLKISQGGFSWGFCAHVETIDGEPATEVEVRLEVP